jgi:DNA-binding response OmpR family regulator
VKEAKEKMVENKFDLIISEFELPQKDGLDFLKELRGKNDETPFILLTFKGQEEIATEALNVGSFGFVKKQTNPEIVYKELSDKINILVKRQKTRSSYKEESFRI